MPAPLRVLAAVLACFALSLPLAGCGPAEQKYETSATPAPVPTAEDNVRTWLEGVAASGELDSGADSVKELLSTLSGPNQAELSQKMDAMMKLNDQNQIKARANEMLKLLPPKG